MELQVIQNKILELRGLKVILDKDLALLYGVETRQLKQAVRRNHERFPSDFCFELDKQEIIALVSQFVIPNYSSLGGVSPMVFTEQGVAMLSSVLRSSKAIEVNISIMRAFVSLRQYYSNYSELKEQIQNIENEMNTKFKDIYEALNYLINPPVKDRKPVGYIK